MKSFVFLPLVLFAMSAFATPVTIPLTRRPQRTGAYLKGSPDANRARAAFLKSHTDSGPTTAPATQLAYTQYTTSVGIGRPPTYYNLLVDASSNTFCGTGRKYVRTSTSIPTGQSVNVYYGLGSFSGLEYLDEVTLAPNLVITNQSIGDALEWADFPGVDGILGIGPVNLTRATLSPNLSATIPTVMNNLVSQNLIKDQVLGVYFAPATNNNDTNGALTYGGVDSSLYEGELTYTPLTNTHPAAQYWGINITSTTYGTQTVIPVSTAGVIDPDITQILLADDYFAVYLDAIPGAKIDSNISLIEIPPSSVPAMIPLDFVIAGRVFTLDAAAQLIPEDQNVAWGGVSGTRYGVIANIGYNSGDGLDFVLGQKFLERYYVVFDTDNKRVGLAQTNNTFSG